MLASPQVPRAFQTPRHMFSPTSLQRIEYQHGGKSSLCHRKKSKVLRGLPRCHMASRQAGCLLGLGQDGAETETKDFKMW